MGAFMYGGVGVVMLVWLTACAPIVPPPPPVVELVLDGPEVIYPGDAVVMRVATAETQTETAYRLSIDQAGSVQTDTGWRNRYQLAGPEFAYTWLAGAPGSYTLVTQVRDSLGQVGELRRQIEVLPFAAVGVTGQAVVYTTKIALPTYPMEGYQTAVIDPDYRWPYQRFDAEAYRTAAPSPQLREYTLLMLENGYLRVSILPELGGRIWQVIHKTSGQPIFYQNSVVKPTPWGPPQQGGWLGLGGLEWALPVNEHGYDWGTAWDVTTFTQEDGAVSAILTTPDDGRLLAASILITLRPDVAYVEVAPTLHNKSNTPLSFHYWQTAMLAPGSGNQAGAELNFVLPNGVMTVHSTGDTALPDPAQQFTWPSYFGRDLSRLGNWDRYLGFFEYPAAHGPFVGVYDTAQDLGVVRVYPAAIARGSKVFGLGWRNPIGSEDYTDDGSSYVELHGGLSPSFFEPTTLAGQSRVGWREYWYPVSDIGNFVYANATAALNVQPNGDGWQIAIYPTLPLRGTLWVGSDGAEIAQFDVDADPTMPFQAQLAQPAQADFALTTPLTFRLENAAGEAVLVYTVNP